MNNTQPEPRSRTSSVIPGKSATRSTLVYVIAIMSFLACLTIGFVALVHDAALDWQSDIGREITIQVKPLEGIDQDGEVAKAIALAKATSGVTDAYGLGDTQTKGLLEPWLGSEFRLQDLPVPRLIVVKAPTATPEALEDLKQKIKQEVKGGSLDDHRQWQTRLAMMARTTIVLGFFILALVLSATVLSVVFATRGVVASNRHIIEVLHYVGADDHYIARQFQGQFLRLGLKAGIAGGLGAIVLFVLAGWLVGRAFATPTGDQLEALIGQFTIGARGYAGIVVIVLIVALATALTSRFTVRRYLATIYP